MSLAEAKASNASDEELQATTPWPVAADESAFVSAAVAIATQRSASWPLRDGGGRSIAPLREALSARILRWHGALYSDEGATEEWTSFLVRLGGPSAAAMS